MVRRPSSSSPQAGEDTERAHFQEGRARRWRAVQWRIMRSCHGCCCAAAAAAAGRLNGHPLLRWPLPQLKADRLLIAPQDLRTADATRATEIYSGRFAFAGKVVICDGRSIFEMEPPSDEWATALLGFGWLRHLRAAESGITRANARALVDEWIALQGSWHPVAWRPDVLSRRIISWLSQATLVLQDADARFYRRFLRSLVRQVRYLRHTAGDARRGVARMQADDRADLRGAVHRRPGAPHQIRDRPAAPRDRAADPARRRPCQPRSRRDHRNPARAAAAAARPLRRATSRRRRRCSTPSTA